MVAEPVENCNIADLQAFTIMTMKQMQKHQPASQLHGETLSPRPSPSLPHNTMATLSALGDSPFPSLSFSYSCS